MLQVKDGKLNTKNEGNEATNGLGKRKKTMDKKFNRRVKSEKLAKKTCKRRGTAGRGGPLTF